MAHTHARSTISHHLTLPSYLTLRILVPLLIYLPLSLSYALISVAFNLPFDARGTTSYAAGFVTFFAFVYLGMAALGLALEAMVTLLGPRFVPFFLVLLVSSFLFFFFLCVWEDVLTVLGCAMCVDYCERIDVRAPA